MNNTIKVLKRNSYGIKSYERLKNKILWQQEMKKLGFESFLFWIDKYLRKPPNK